MPFSQRTGYKCLVFLLVVFLLSVQAFSDDLKNKAEENPLNCARYLIAKVYAENDSLSPEPGFLSLAYWKLGRRTEALQMLEFVDNSGEKTYLLMLFAEALAKENHRDEAATLINKAFEITKGSFAWEEMNTFAKMATQLVLLSKDLDALGIAYVLDEAEEQANILTEIAYEYLRQGKNDKALELLAEALPLIKESQYQDRKAFVMAKIGDAYALAGKRVEAGELLSQAAGLNKENAKSNNFSTEKVSCVIANGYLTLGKEEHIPNLFEEPEEAQRILAVHHLKQGEKEKARIILSAIKESYKRDCKNLQIVDWCLKIMKQLWKPSK
jgi:tetratricopeptide (TPR) repeat protein